MKQQFQVIRAADRIDEAGSGAMVREAAVSRQLVGAERLWMGYAELAAGMVSAAHHHGEAESGIYVVSGRARFFSGEGLSVVQDAAAGDFIWVPPHEVHVEMNASDTDPVRMVVARSTQEVLVFNVPAPTGWMPHRPD
ncbi:MAG: cupin domain-containing protein [Actinomycetota bacterium]|nr:cupin domain-containing protein [Actinomycetota bacterium]